MSPLFGPCSYPLSVQVTSAQSPSSPLSMKVTSVRSPLFSTINACHLCPVFPLLHYQCMSPLPSPPFSPPSMQVTSVQSPLFSTINTGHLFPVPLFSTIFQVLMSAPACSILPISSLPSIPSLCLLYSHPIINICSHSNILLK